MATILKSFDFASRRRVMYPWDQWTDGKIRKAIKGEDFTSKPESFISQLYTVAGRRKLGVRTSMSEDAVVFQFFEK